MTTGTATAPVHDLAGLNFNELVDFGRMAVRGDRAGVEWALGDAVRELEARFPERLLEDYAEDVGLEVRTLQEYRRVAAAYPAEARRPRTS